MRRAVLQDIRVGPLERVQALGPEDGLKPFLRGHRTGPDHQWGDNGNDAQNL